MAAAGETTKNDGEEKEEDRNGKSRQFERRGGYDELFFSLYVLQVQMAKCKKSAAVLKEGADTMEIGMEACVKMTTVLFSIFISPSLSVKESPLVMNISFSYF